MQAIGRYSHIAHATNSRMKSITGIIHSDDGTPQVERHNWFIEELSPWANEITLRKKFAPHIIPTPTSTTKQHPPPLHTNSWIPEKRTQGLESTSCHWN